MDDRAISNQVEESCHVESLLKGDWPEYMYGHVNQI